ncbi:SHOCT domain-containing protein [Nocardia cyriacigeorgica]|uniref:SHOCT domain-containing protein n=1 Tax=Nocardia cyriacigeorgica TaxID=135487 RepID=A0A5R8PKA8_9NOCA|nr:SHOCT domain-containing protein [Nocardia cyriacigeorgica]TLG17664.1 SHOCT domain-containing protein [Nocardia cyriacigeorgica]
MTTYLTPETATLLADHYNGDWHPWPFFWIFPLLFWTTIIVLAVLVGRARFRRDTGVGALRDAYARGEITEAQYRERLAVLRETKR